MGRRHRQSIPSPSEYAAQHDAPVAGEFGQEGIYRQRAEQRGYAQAGYGRPGYGSADASNSQAGPYAASSQAAWAQNADQSQGDGQARYSQGVPGQGGGYSQGGFEPGYDESRGGHAMGGAGLGGYVEGAFGQGRPLGQGGLLQQGAYPGDGPRRGGHRGRGPRGYQRSDERIREDVCEALCEDDDVDASDIEVSVENGEVQLSGTAPNRFMKRWAEDLAEQCSGVRDVHNRLRIKQDDSPPLTSTSHAGPPTDPSGRSNKSSKSKSKSK